MVCSYPRSVHVNQHERAPHKVRGHWRNTKWGRIWIGEFDRNGSIVSEHCRSPR